MKSLVFKIFDNQRCRFTLCSVIQSLTESSLHCSCRFVLNVKENPSYQDDYWDARQGNDRSRITFHLCREKTKWRKKLPEGFTCPIPPSMKLILRGGNGSFQVVWRTHLEVDLKRTQNYWAELLVLYYIHATRLTKYGIRMRKLTCARGSCKNNTLPRFPGEMLQLVAVLNRTNYKLNPKRAPTLRDLHPGYIGGRCGLSSLRHSCPHGR